MASRLPCIIGLLDWPSQVLPCLVAAQRGNKSIEIQVTDARHSIYLYACEDTLVKVHGKCNNISLDTCRKTGIMFSDVIASCEAVNCKSVQMQTTGVVPTISVEKTDGAQIFLPKGLTANSDFQVVTAKCSEINVVVVGAADEDPLEEPIPEQFVTTFVKGRPVTVAASHSGA
eukprot:366278-Chlamydomonas_euryale.AAC.21